MLSLLLKVLDWSEVWALLIPLIVLVKYKRQPRYLHPVIAYLFLGLMLDIFIDIGYVYKENAPLWMFPNNYLYNIHSIVRFICFSLFFSRLRQPFPGGWKRIVPIAAMVLVGINFIFFEKFYIRDNFSSLLFAVESAVLLFYCLQYYLFKMQEDIVGKRGPDFWVVTGLSIYVVFNFIYFLLYTSLLKNGYKDFVINMWHFHNVSFIVLCIFIAKAFYVPRNK